VTDQIKIKQGLIAQLEPAALAVLHLLLEYMYRSSRHGENNSRRLCSWW